MLYFHVKYFQDRKIYIIWFSVLGGVISSAEVWYVWVETVKEPTGLYYKYIPSNPIFQFGFTVVIILYLSELKNRIGIKHNIIYTRKKKNRLHCEHRVIEQVRCCEGEKGCSHINTMAVHANLSVDSGSAGVCQLPVVHNPSASLFDVKKQQQQKTTTRWPHTLLPV